MKALPLAPVRPLQNSKFCLCGIAVGLTACHLVLIWRVSNNIDQLIISIIFWGAILCQVWRKQDSLNLESDIFSSFLGILLIALIFFKSISLFWFESSFLRVFPFIATLSLGLLASGIRGLKQYWQELAIVLLLCLPASLLTPTVDRLFHVSQLTTAFAVFILWYVGFDVTRLDTTIILPNGAATVSPACTGISTLLLLLKLAVIYILIFPINRRQKIFLFLGAIFISFVTSELRVALIATAVGDRAAFDYWHGTQGNQIFSTVSILLFSLLCRCLLSFKESSSIKTTKGSQFCTNGNSSDR